MGMDLKKWAAKTRGNARVERIAEGKRFESGVMNEKVNRDLEEAWIDLKAADLAFDRSGDLTARRKKDIAIRDLEQAIADAKRYSVDTADWERRLAGMKA